MGEAFDPYRDALVVEEKTVWPDEVAGLSDDEKARIEKALHADATGVTELDYTAVQPPSFTVAEGSDDKGEPIRVTVLGRDAASDDWLNKAWRFAWYHESGSPFGAGRRQKVEHAALTQVLAERGHVNVPKLRAVGVGGAGDALLISATAGVP